MANNFTLMAYFQKKIFAKGGIIPRNEKTFQGLRLNYALSRLKKISGKVLEVGCGAGRVMNSIKYYLPELSCYGCDLNENAVKIASESNCNINFQICSVEKLPYADNTFSAVIGFDIFEHLSYIERGIAEVARVITNDGILIAFIPLEGSPLSPYRKPDNFKLKQSLTGHIKPYTYEEVMLLFSKKFKIVDNQFAYHFIGSRYDLKIHRLSAEAVKQSTKFNEPFWLQKMHNLAYYESKLLKNCRFGAIGMFLTAKI